MNTQALLAENARLRRENEYLKMQIANVKHPQQHCESIGEINAEHKELLAHINALGYNSAKDYITEMANVHGVDLEEARQAFLACGYEEWNNGFIKELIKVKEKKDGKQI